MVRPRQNKRGDAVLGHLDGQIPGYAREELNVFSTDEWQQMKRDYILESWVQAAAKDGATVIQTANPAEIPKAK